MTHKYSVRTTWQGNRGTGTSGILAYDRSHSASVAGKPELQLTTDNAKVGDKSKLNPEDLLLTALSSCHMLSYLYVCAQEGVVITSYTDDATAEMDENLKGGGNFTIAVLRPVVQVRDQQMKARAIELHHKAHEVCYIANSVNFEVKVIPAVL